MSMMGNCLVVGMACPGAEPSQLSGSGANDNRLGAEVAVTLRQATAGPPPYPMLALLAPWQTALAMTSCLLGMSMDLVAAQSAFLRLATRPMTGAPTRPNG